MPITILVTVLDSKHARRHALMTIGVDEFITKPFTAENLVRQLAFCQLRRRQALPTVEKKMPQPPSRGNGKFKPPPFVGIGLAASTGGVDAISHVVKPLNPVRSLAGLFIVQHGADWMLETFAEMLASQTEFAVHLAEDGMPARPGHIYIAPGDKHMALADGQFSIRLSDGPEENYVKPCADKLFRSLADAFGRFSVAAVLTGLGCDGAAGSASIQGQGGVVFAQQPETCVAPYMPQSVIKLGLANEVVPLETLGNRISERARELSEALRATVAG